jgi:NAD(P)-dependent dehydrogenase (short-subunit alcohol dehydrogenase family)
MATHPFSLEGKIALVTGANTGLGQGIALALAAAGADIAGAGIVPADDTAAKVQALGRRFLSIEANLISIEPVGRVVQETVEALGGLDILVNNAGTCYHNESWDVTDEQWSSVFDLNVRALWKASLSAGRHMRENGGGSIVNIGSMSGLIVNRPQMQPAYNASKAAVHHLTKSLAAEWAPHNIRVNALAPGYVKTEMAPVDRPEFQRYWLEDAPMRRFALPEEIAPSVVFLASDAASFITGSVLVADGGYTLW